MEGESRDTSAVDAVVNAEGLLGIPERIVPGRADRLQTADHMARYRFAATRTRGKTLDLGCGVGYGSAIILAAPNVESVVAFDVNRKALVFGRDTYGRFGKSVHGRAIPFVQGSAEALPFLDNSMDTIVCLEAIEHVRDADIVLSEISRVLRPKGLLIISTPNKWATSPVMRRPLNPYHTVEWYPRTFKQLVSRYFDIEEVLGQSWYPFGIIWQAFLLNVRGRLKVVLHYLRLLDFVQRLRRGTIRRDPLQPNEGMSGTMDLPDEREVKAARPHIWKSMRKQGVPVTIIVAARSPSLEQAG